MAEIKVDVKQVENLEKEVKTATVKSLGKLGARGFKILRREVPYKLGNLRQGVAEPLVDESALTATLVVSALTGKIGSSGVSVSAKGKRKPIALKPQIAFNYAEVVARGRPALRPRAGKALLIEIKGTPDGAYIEAGGKTYVVRKSAAAVPANPFDERAATQLEREAPAIVGAVFDKFFN